MHHLSDAQRWKLLADSDSNQAAGVLAGQTEEKARKITEELGVAYMVHVVNNLGTDAASDLLRHLPGEFRSKILSLLTSDKVKDIEEVLSYPAGSAGAIMAKEVLAIPEEFNIRQATEYLQAIPQNRKGTVSYIYVVDKNRRLLGVIQVRDLIYHGPDTPVKNILRRPVVQVETGMTQMDVAKLLQRHRYLGLPVVDEAQKLVGVVSAAKALQVFEDEATDDIAKIVGTSAEEIRTKSVLKITRLRLPWLMVSIMSGLLCAFITGIFQQGFPAMAVLFLFIPVVLGLSESAGVQGATIVVRNITLGHLSGKDLGSLFFRESLVGILIGVICGLLVGLFTFFWKTNNLLSLALAVSMSIAIIVSCLIGLLLPMIFKRFKIDPAVASGPLVLAICDLQTLYIYFSIASSILNRP